MKKIFIIFVLFLCSKPTFSQIAKFESDLLTKNAGVGRGLNSTNRDSINYYTTKFSEQLQNYIIKNPQSLNYKFSKLISSKLCEIATSKDGLFRIYSWDLLTGGSMHFFSSIFQFKAKGQIYTFVPKEIEGDAGCFYSKIHSVNIGNKTYYLAIGNGIYSTKDANQSIQAFLIEKNKLIDTQTIFKTKNKELNRIDVNFDFFSVVDRPERPVELIKYDSIRQIIFIPVVKENGAVTNKNIQYKLKEDKFEFIGIE